MASAAQDLNTWWDLYYIAWGSYPLSVPQEVAYQYYPHADIVCFAGLVNYYFASSEIKNAALAVISAWEKAVIYAGEILTERYFDPYDPKTLICDTGLSIYLPVGHPGVPWEDSYRGLRFHQEAPRWFEFLRRMNMPPPPP